MITSRIISNISYNTFSYFTSKVKDLTYRGIIDWCYWIKHLPDDDDTKEHIHFVLKPSKRIDTSDLRTFFFEADTNSDKPLTCTMKWFATNSLDDWLLYAIHHPAYLSSKGQSRIHLYQFKDIQSTDDDALRNDISAIDMRKYLVLQWLEDAARSRIPFFQLVQQGLIPISQRSQYEFQYKALWSDIHQAKAHPRAKLEYAQDDLPTPFD